jgi:hypothetical protein
MFEELCYSDAGYLSSSGFSENDIISFLLTFYLLIVLAIGTSLVLTGAGGLLPLPLDWLLLGIEGFLSRGAFLS